MTSRPAPSLAASIVAAHAWWREAGVDHDFDDTPRAWLAEAEAEAPALPQQVQARAREAKPPPPAAPRIGGERADWPVDLDGFRRWWLNDPSLHPAGGRRRLGPRGGQGAAVMFVVPMPEADDADALLSGREGRLLASLARAMELSEERVYLASALPAHDVAPDWAALAEGGLGDVLRHHVALAAPQRVIVFGGSILPLFGHDPAQGAPAPSEIAIQAGALPLLATLAPGNLLRSAGQRALLWRRWLDWTDTEGE